MRIEEDIRAGFPYISTEWTNNMAYIFTNITFCLSFRQYEAGHVLWILCEVVAGRNDAEHLI